jgi:hypothetical protein
MRPDKVIATNAAALRAKYGAGFDVQAAIEPMLAADRKRVLQTQVIDMSDTTQMRGLGGSRVSQPDNQRQDKAAVDAIFTKLRPHYLMILGSVDVVPHQDLQNDIPDDPDTFSGTAQETSSLALPVY